MESAEIRDDWWQLPESRDKKTGQFLPGHAGGAGRKKGSPVLFSEAMISDLFEDWKGHGIQAIREVREKRPLDYLRIVAAIISKGGLSESLSDDFRDEALEQIIEERRRQALLMIAKMRGQD